MESSMHVPAWAFMNCEATFGFPSLPSAPSVNIPASFTEGGSSQLEPSGVSSGVLEHTKALAACLATPVEPPPASNEAASNILRGLRGYTEEFGSVVDRWGNLVRRLQRRRHIERVQAALASLASGASFLSLDDNEGVPNFEGQAAKDGGDDALGMPRLSSVGSGN